MEYLKDLNGTKAAERAGYSKKTARFIAAENLTKPNISAEIERLSAKVMTKAEVAIVGTTKPVRSIYVNSLNRIGTKPRAAHFSDSQLLFLISTAHW